MTNFFKIHTAAPFAGWRYFVIATCLGGFLFSCTTPQKSSYFKNIKKDTALTVKYSGVDALKIQSGDVLTITVSSLNKAEDLIFNTDQGGYEVGSDGNIHFHRLGMVPVAGLNRRQVKLKLQENLQPFLKDPIAVVNFANHYITVMGDVGSPRSVPMPQERITIIDAMAQSGNVPVTAELSNVMIIRDSSTTVKTIHHINLEDHSVFNSDYYYLKPNDMVVVNYDEKLARRQQSQEKYQQVSATIFQAVSMALLIYNAFFR